MSTKRQVIESLRSKLRERTTDSTFTNQFLYNILLEHAKWLIKREISKGAIYSNTFFFQTLRCQTVVETSTIDPCCPVKTNCKIFRTKHKIPDMWIDEDGPLIKRVLSVDNTTEWTITTATTWANKKDNPYQKMLKQMHTFYADGYLWFPEYNPNKINIVGFWVDDVIMFDDCDENKECVRFLDTRFALPPWLEAECSSKALEQIAGVSERLQEDNQPDKNTSRKN